MSGPQHLAWYRTAMRETGSQKLMDLTVLTAPNDEEQFYKVRDHLLEMAERKQEE